jgi:PTH1 family peptidyl-tRNA hydrolase
MNAGLTIIAGLGNPDARYERTLHNAGFWFADAVVRDARESFRRDRKFDAEVCKVTIANAEVWIVKPQSYMNNSGGPVRSMLDYYRLPVETLLVAHDEIDLPPGTARLKKGGGHGGHNGVRDIIQHCGSDFLRLRLGVGHPGVKDKVTGYVLQRGPKAVEEVVEQAVARSVEVLPLLVERGTEAAMNRLHTAQNDGN